MKTPILSPQQIEAAARKIAAHVDDDGPGLSEEKERRLYETIRKILSAISKENE